MAFHYETNPTPSLSVGSTTARPIYTMASAAPSDLVIQQGAWEATRVSPEIGPDPRISQSMVHLTEVPVMEMECGLRFDFNNGYRIASPAAMPPCLVRVYDLETQTLLDERMLKPGQMVVGERKYFIRYRFEVVDRATGKMLACHDYDCVGKRVMIVVPDGGLGDNLAWLPYVEAFRIEHRADVTCVCGEWLIRLVKDQYLELHFLPIASHPSCEGFYASYFCAIFTRERLSWRPSEHQYFGMQGSVARILGVRAVPRRTRLKLDAPRPFPEPYVVIATMATNPAKFWNYPNGWNAVCRYLKRLGFRVLVIDRDHDLRIAGKDYRVPSEAEDFTGRRPLSERIAFLQHAEFFIGLPSGLSWLAWCCRVPVVMLAGFTHDGSEFPTPYRVFNQNFCHGCWNDSGCFYDPKAPVWCPRHLGTPREIECTRSITPGMVVEQLNCIPCVRQRLAPPISVILRPADVPEFVLAASMESLTAAAAEYANAEILISEEAIADASQKALLNEWRRRFPKRISFFSGAPQPAGRFLFYCSTGDILLENFHFRNGVEALEKQTDMAALGIGAFHFGKNGLVGAEADSARQPSAILVRADAVRTEDGNMPLDIADVKKCINYNNLFNNNKIHILSYTAGAVASTPEPGAVPGTVLEAWAKIRPAADASTAIRAVPEKRISVILSVFRGDYLRPCVESVVRAFAPYGRTELLLRNDASPEPGLDWLLDQLAVEHRDMIRVFRDRENLGIARSRNYLIERSCGDYIVCFDHDDLMLPFDVEKVVAFMDSHPEYAASYAPKYLFSDEKGYLHEIHGSRLSHFTAFFAPKVNVNATFFRRGPLLEAGGFLEVHGDKMSGLDDAYLFTRLFQLHDLHFDPDARTLYRMHPRQITAEKPKRSNWDDWITKEACAKYPELYDRIQRGDIPDVHGPDQRVVRALMGAAAYFHQKDVAVWRPILDVALREFPDDPGLPDIYLRLLHIAGQYQAMEAYAAEALKRFADNPLCRMTILNDLLISYSARKVPPPPELQKRHAEAAAVYFRLSPLAEKYMPKAKA
ncbi:MAG: autotransporter strand-loop-strand O-heptosyltransferase [Victivallales bacterium]|nr:autotransporter strand-loop-strand O-heptosyltransferase [Victivallales bacterium]